MHRILAILLAAASVAIAVPAGASHENEPGIVEGAAACRRGQGWIAQPEVDTGSLLPDGRRFYLDADPDLMPDPFLFSVWIYEESNGIDALQRADGARDTTCAGHLGVGDTLVF